jgi:CRISPR/Cas system-associated protein Cas5 (RAMP superfamily)
MARIGSKKSLVAKLGIKEGQRIRIINAPSKYDVALGRLPKNVVEAGSGDSELDFIQLFTCSEEELRREFPKLMRTLKKEGIFWISYPRTSSKIDSDLVGVTVRAVGTGHGMAEVKISSLDEDWAGIKFVNKKKELD